MRLDRLSALIVAFVVILVGATYVSHRPVTWTSDAQVVLIPGKATRDTGNPLDSFTAGGTLGTSVELLSSPDLAAQVAVPGVSFSVRAVADSRVISVSANGPRDAVRPALADLLRVAVPAQQRLADRWQLSALTRPTPAAPAGPGMTMLLVVCLLLGALAATVVYAAARHWFPELAARRVHLPRRQRHGPRRVRRSWRAEHER